MDIRRGPPRSSSGGVEPRYRQVGFVTSTEPAVAAAAATAAVPVPAPPPGDASPPASDGLSPVMIPPPLIPDHLPVPGSESLMPSSPPPASSSRLDALSDIDDDVDVSWARPPPPAVLEPNKRDLAEKKNEGDSTSVPQKPKLSKAERRAIQEAQRAAKAAAKETGLKSTAKASDGNTKISKQPKAGKASLKKDVTQVKPPVASDKKIDERPPDKVSKKDVPQPRMQFDDAHRVVKAKKRSVVNQSEAQNRVELFRHLPQYAHGTQLPDLESKFFQPDLMHPSVYEVGLQYLTGDISGGNARCIAMLLAFREAINDYSTPAEKILSRDLTAKISSYVSFLIECRPLSISMGNAIRFFKNRITKLPLALSESEAKASLQSDIDRFINEKIIVAGKVIVSHAVTKIRDDDVLLTYGSASVVEMIFDHAHELGKKFRVVVVDSRPNLEGQGLLRRLVAKVLSNGTVYSRVGTASVAMVAHSFGVPVLMCCEAYKFHERVQLDSICFNELGDPDAISRVTRGQGFSHLKNWAENENLHILNLKYDITPSDYVSMLITDYGMLPPTSVPVIVREYRREHVWI
ncbi:unnamed protein product [Urochloa humidicola]